jgi:hypothetical protein
MAFKVAFRQGSDVVEYTNEDRWSIGDNGTLTVVEAEGSRIIYAAHAWYHVEEGRDPDRPMVFGI